MFFGKKQQNPLDAFLRDGFFCSRCGKMVSLQGYTPMEVGKCVYCSEINFIPMRISDFWLFQPLGGGGMGSVYKACRESEPTRYYAVKVLPRCERSNPTIIAALEAEIAVAAAITGHDCLVNAIEWGIDEDEHYMAMEFIEGERLDKRIERLGKISENELIYVSLRLLGALTHIYNRGYLFRDMKPQNIIIHEVYGAYLFDYGICMDRRLALNNDNDLVQGSPIYLPPERLLGEPETVAGEIYSLGMVMFHAISGEPYFTAQDMETLVRRHMTTARMKNAGNKMQGISPDLVSLLDRMIKRDPGSRHQSYHEVETLLIRMFNARRTAS